jgi:isoprenylcysteine carboxyl methyltransferase (ICMT) family protein YpbQ
MVSDPISNQTNSADDFCNVIINTSSDIAKDIGVTYGELWTYTTFLVIGLIVFYMVLTYAALYTKHKKTIKWAFWISLALIAVGIFILMSIISTLYVNP